MTGSRGWEWMQAERQQCRKWRRLRKRLAQIWSRAFLFSSPLSHHRTGAKGGRPRRQQRMSTSAARRDEPGADIRKSIASDNGAVVFTADTDEYPLEWMKRVLSRALWSQRYFWSVAGLCIALDIFFTSLIVLAVRCESCLLHSKEVLPSDRSPFCRHRDRLFHLHAASKSLQQGRESL